jgi:hypothetical protein
MNRIQIVVYDQHAACGMAIESVVKFGHVALRRDCAAPTSLKLFDVAGAILGVWRHTIAVGAVNL